MRTFALLFAVGAVACSGNDDSRAPLSPLPAPSPSIQGIAPSTAFRGRPFRFDLGAVGTVFSKAPRVRVHGGKIAVDSVDVLSTTALRVYGFVPSGIAESKADVEVDGLVLASGLLLAEPIELGSKRVMVKQGLSTTHTLINRDAEHPFREGQVALDLGKGIAAFPTVVTPSTLTFELKVAPDAAPGERDLRVTLLSASEGDAGADTGPPGREMVTVVPKVVKVDALAVTDLPASTPATVTVPKGIEGAWLRAKDSAGRLLSFRCTKAVDEKGNPVRALLSLYDPATSKLVSSIAGDELLVPAAPGSDPLLFVGPSDWTIAMGTTLTVVLDGYAPSSLAEAEPNGAIASANVATPPFVATGALDNLDDVDVFKLAVPAGTLVVRTLPKGESEVPTDTAIELLDATGKLFASNEDEDPASNAPMSFARAKIPAPTTVYVRVRPGGIATTGGEYRLAAVMR